MKTIKIISASTLAAALLTGCAKSPPKCSDEGTFTLIRQIIVDQIGGREGVTDEELKENMKIELPRASAFDEKIKKYTCEAKLVAGGTIELPITYESQLDDSSQHIVSVDGISNGDLLQLKIAISQGIQEMRGGRTETAPPVEEQVSQQIAPAPSTQEQAPAVQAPEKSWSPSFDCAKASTFSEKSVCSDPLLGKLDGALSENYKNMLASDIGDGARGDLKETQKKWLGERNKCTDIQCLTNAYRFRIDEMCEYPVISGTHPICASSDEIN